MDYAQPSGSPHPISPSCAKAVGGYSHTLSAVDLGSGRAFSFLTKSTKGALSHLTRIHKLHMSRGYSLQHLHTDRGLDHTELRSYCSKHSTAVHVGTPYEHHQRE